MMKRFKFGLVGLFVGFVGLLSFSNAGYVSSTGTVEYRIVTLGSTGTIVNGCFYCNSRNYGGFRIYNSSDVEITNGILAHQTFCFIDTSGRYSNGGTSNYGCTFVSQDLFATDCPECQECVTCDTNYCVENDLCPVSSGGRSELVINDIVHQSAPLINIHIPFEYSWDYTVDDNEFSLDISGYNVDYEYIDGIIKTQKFTPDSDDFNNIITGLVPLLIPGLVIILFIWFIFRFIKKIF